MKKGILFLKKEMAFAAHRSLLFSALSGAGDTVFYLTTADLRELLSSDPGTYEPLRRALRRGRLALLPQDPFAPACGEGMLLRSLFAAEQMAAAYGIRPAAPVLFSAPVDPATLEVLSHFGQETVYVLSAAPRAKEELLTPDGTPVTVRFLPSEWRADRIEFFVPAEKRAPKDSDKDLTEPVGKDAEPYVAYPLVSPVPSEANVRALLEEGRALSSFFEKKLLPLVATLSFAGVAVPSLTSFSYALSEGSSALSRARLSSLREEMEKTLTLMMETAASTLSPAQADVVGELLLFQSAPFSVQTAARARILLPPSVAYSADPGRSLSLCAEDGCRLPFEVLSVVTLPDGKREAEISFDAGRLPPLSFARYFLRSEHTDAPKKPKSAEKVIENAHYRIAVSEGELLLFVKKTGDILKNPFFLEEQGSSVLGGFRSAAEGSLLSYPDLAATAISSTATALSLDFSMEIPASYDFLADERSTVMTRVSVRLSLSFGGEDGELLQLSYAIEDPAAHHRLRLAVRTGRIPADITVVEGRRVAAFPLGVLPVADLYAHDAGDAHFAAIPMGQTGAEWVNDTLYLALLTADVAPVGRSSGRLAVSLGPSLPLAALAARGQYAKAAPIAHFRPLTKEKSEDTAPCVAKDLLRMNALATLSWSGEGVLPLVCKPAEDGRGVILRFANLADGESTLSFHADSHLALTGMKEEAELPLGDRDARLRMAPRQSLTLRLYPLSFEGSGEEASEEMATASAENTTENAAIAAEGSEKSPLLSPENTHDGKNL